MLMQLQGRVNFLPFLKNVYFLIEDTDLQWQILAPIHLLWFAIHKNRKTTCPKVENEISNIVLVQFILHLLKASTMMDNNYILVTILYTCIPTKKSLFSITLILICITLSLVTLLGNRFSFYFIALRYKRNVISLRGKPQQQTGGFS